MEAKRASNNAKKAAMVARNDLRSLRNEHTPNSTLNITESREEEHRFAPLKAEYGNFIAKKQIFHANTRVLDLQRRLTFLVGDASMEEVVRAVTGPELVYCKDRNLLMYPKDSRPRFEELIDSEDEASSDSSESEDDIEDIVDHDQLF